MHDLRFGLGMIWIVFTMVAAALLGTDFILHEIRSAIRNYRDSHSK